MKAFPCVYMDYIPSSENRGMDLRDYFAAKAMPSIYSVYSKEANTLGWEVNWSENIAKSSYKIADAMMKARAE